MMRNLTIVASAGLFALAACGGGDKGSGNAAAAGAGEDRPSAQDSAAPGAVKLDPGEWEVTSEMTKVSGTGLPPAAIAAMQGQKQTTRQCITPEQASHPLDMSGDAKKNCDYSKFAMGGGRMDGTITCKAGKDGGATVSMTMNGQFSARSYQAAMSMTTGSKEGAMTMEMRASAHRIGECKAGAEG
jgi:hypothetical protein